LSISANLCCMWRFLQRHLIQRSPLQSCFINQRKYRRKN